MLKHFRSGSKRIRSLWWVLTIGTVVTFIGGFIVFGPGTGDGSLTPQTADVIGKVAGKEVRQSQLVSAEQTAARAYASQYGSEPLGNTAALVREQAWTNLVAERAVDGVARRYGLTVSDAEVVYAAKNSPPPDVTLEPTFMTNGRFDVAKWRQALADPSVDWSPLEQRMRDVLPAQRLEERVIAGVKISEPELLRLYSTQYDRVKASYVYFPLDPTPIDTTKLADAELRRYYDAHKGEFQTGTQVQAELVQFPVSVDADAEAIAKSDAETIVREIRGGRDFAEVARERSEGPYTENGGDMGQDVAMARLPATLKPLIEALQPGEITDPVRDGNTYFIFKLVTRGAPAGDQTQVRLAQIQKPVRPSSESVQKDYEAITKLRADAARQPLPKLAAARQLVSVNTGWFGEGQYVPMLVSMPQIQQWALTAKKGAVSRAYGTETGWILVQIVDRREAGPRPFEDAKDDVRRAVEIQLRQVKPLADAKRLADAVKAGQSLEQAAAAMGLAVAATDTFARSNPNVALRPAPKAVGLAFGLPVGKVGGPVAAPNGAYVIRKDILIPGDPMQYQQIKGQLSSQLLTARQQRWLRSWVEKTVAEAKVEDRRAPIEPVL
jgi:peptidyl-prolyl cis-trans isomerase D